MSKAYCLFDYDGFVCKAFYAAKSRNDIASAGSVLEELFGCAIVKALDMYDELSVIKVMSKHTWKKKKYKTYKQNRKKDKDLSEFRDSVIANESDILLIDKLEADDIISMLGNYIYQTSKSPVIVFSDDKDLRYYSPDLYCKINVSEEVNISEPDNKYWQMLAGDSEDDIKGVPNVGEKKAKLLLDSIEDKSLSDFQKVISIYKQKGVPIEECVKNLELIIPIHPGYVTKYGRVLIKLIYKNLFTSNPNKEKINNLVTSLIEQFEKYIKDEVEEGYNKC